VCERECSKENERESEGETVRESASHLEIIGLFCNLEIDVSRSQATLTFLKSERMGWL